MMMRKPIFYIKTFSLVFFTFIFSAGCKNESAEPSPVVKNNPGKNNSNTTEAPQFTKEGELTFFKADGTTAIVKINIELAETVAEQQKGLMNRSWMEENQGMLFIFEEERQQAFWMHNTIIPLDIIYVNSKKEIVSMAKDTTPFSDQSIPSAKPAQYVIEVIAGFCDKYGVAAGSRVDWQKM